MTETSTNITRTASSQQPTERLTSLLAALVEKAGHTLYKAIDDAANLEVVTYVSDDMGNVTYDVATGQLTGAVKVRALTRISIDGDTQVCIPEKAGEVDTDILRIHNEMVKQARATRAELIQTAFTTAKDLFTQMQTPE